MAICGEQTPCNCQDTPCGCKTSTDDVVYTGPTLPCTLIENCTTVTEVITVFNNYLCSPDFMSGIIQTIINTPALLEQIVTIVNNDISCETIWACQSECNSWTYDIEVKNCEDCTPIGVGGITNGEQLEIGKWYYYNGGKVLVTGLLFCSPIAAPILIAASSVEDTCEAVICPTTTTTTTSEPTTTTTTTI